MKGEADGCTGGNCNGARNGEITASELDAFLSIKYDGKKGNPAHKYISNGLGDTVLATKQAVGVAAISPRGLLLLGFLLAGGGVLAARRAPRFSRR